MAGERCNNDGDVGRESPRSGWRKGRAKYWCGQSGKLGWVEGARWSKKAKKMQRQQQQSTRHGVTVVQQRQRNENRHVGPITDERVMPTSLVMCMRRRRFRQHRLRHTPCTPTQARKINKTKKASFLTRSTCRSRTDPVSPVRGRRRLSRRHNCLGRLVEQVDSSAHPLQLVQLRDLVCGVA